MKKEMSKLALAIGALVMAGGAMAVDSTTASAAVTATVLTPLKIVKNNDLVFGDVVGGNGVVTVSTTGVRSKSGAAGFIGISSPSAAEFTVTGDANNSFDIDFGGSSTVLTSPSLDTMAIDWITEAVASTATGSTTVAQSADGTLASGSAKIFSGASLTVGQFQAPGTYTGTLVVNVTYN
ncbi:MAG: DUF4402 domain-containing protein [Pseudomonadota bacterium]|nr:DUF4402 domain-containing protein [Pseudomonadota bacterium]